MISEAVALPVINHSDMKKVLLSIGLLLGFIGGSYAQEIKPQEAVADDYIRLFNEMGYKVYSYDISQYRNIRSYQPVILHYRNEAKEGENVLPFKWEIFGDYIRNVKVTVSPIEKGNKAGVYFDDTKGISLPLTFQGQKSPEGDVNYDCQARPFKLDGSKINDDFYPLVLIGSYWYDSDAGMFRFCGDSEISGNPDDDFMKHIPEYYIIGIRLLK